MKNLADTFSLYLLLHITIIFYEKINFEIN